MKYRCRFKATNDVITSDDAAGIHSALAAAREVKVVWDRYVESDEIITIEFNTKTRTAKAVPARKYRR